jgi:protein-S-isoprenylcysteine O-methyltransferase Ste14
MAFKTIVENYRLPLTWGGGILVLALLLLTGGRWEGPLSAVSSALFAAGMFLVGIASMGRLWCALYIAGYKDEQLVTEGPYAMCRNPLYLFSLVGAVGVGLCTETLTIPAVAAVLFASAYPMVIRSEEDRLAQRFGEPYKAYWRRTPAFWPRIGLLHEPDTYVVNPKVFRRNMFDALWFVWMIGFLEIVEELHELGMLPIVFNLY